MGNFVGRIFKTLRDAGARFLSGAQKEFNRKVQIGKYDLDALIQISEFNNGDKGTKAAADWLKNGIKSKELEFYKGSFMEAGKLYFFRYPNPKTRDTLEFFDAEPLVLCLGHYMSKDNELIEIGINLHHLPLKPRRQVLIKVFEMFARKYKNEMYRDEQASINIQWMSIAKPLMIYGTGFALRSYCANRKLECVEFKYEDWDKAIYVPSMKYVGIDQSRLAALWKQYVMTKSFTEITPDRLASILGSH